MYIIFPFYFHDDGVLVNDHVRQTFLPNYLESCLRDDDLVYLKGEKEQVCFYYYYFK